MQHLKPDYDKEGKSVSPALPAEVKNFLIDIDGTICDDIPNEEPHRMVTIEPYSDALATINRWFEEGHIISFFTSRTESHRSITVSWLDRHGFNYHNLIMGKPRGGNYHWIDNRMVRATQLKGKFSEFIIEQKSIEVFK